MCYWEKFFYELDLDFKGNTSFCREPTLKTYRDANPWIEYPCYPRIYFICIFFQYIVPCIHPFRFIPKRVYQNNVKATWLEGCSSECPARPQC